MISFKQITPSLSTYATTLNTILNTSYANIQHWLTEMISFIIQPSETSNFQNDGKNLNANFLSMVGLLVLQIIVI